MHQTGTRMQMYVAVDIRVYCLCHPFFVAGNWDVLVFVCFGFWLPDSAAT